MTPRGHGARRHGAARAGARTPSVGGRSGGAGGEYGKYGTSTLYCMLARAFFIGTIKRGASPARPRAMGPL